MAFEQVDRPELYEPTVAEYRRQADSDDNAPEDPDVEAEAS